jgi:hypothetical protein
MTRAPQDPFVGTFRIDDPRDNAQLFISALAANAWQVNILEPGKERSAFFGSSRFIRVEASVLSQVFTNDSPIGQIGCLSPNWTPVQPVICTIPAGVNYGLVQSMVEGRRALSRTGYILLLGTAAGASAIDMVRQPSAGAP